jgi:hypothetical protein
MPLGDYVFIGGKDYVVDQRNAQEAAGFAEALGDVAVGGRGLD